MNTVKQHKQIGYMQGGRFTTYATSDFLKFRHKRQVKIAKEAKEIA